MKILPLQFLSPFARQALKPNAKCFLHHVGKRAIIGVRKLLDGAEDFGTHASGQADLLFRFREWLPRHCRKCNECGRHFNPSYNIFVIDTVYLFPVQCQRFNPSCRCVAGRAASNRESWMDSVGKMFREGQKPNGIRFGIREALSLIGRLRKCLSILIGVTGFEPATSWSRTKSVAGSSASKTLRSQKKSDLAGACRPYKTRSATGNNFRNGISGYRGEGGWR